MKCKTCGAEFEPTDAKNKYCSAECRRAAQAGASTPNYVVPKAVYKKTARSILKDITKELSKLFR